MKNIFWAALILFLSYGCTNSITNTKTNAYSNWIVPNKSICIANGATFENNIYATQLGLRRKKSAKEPVQNCLN